MDLPDVKKTFCAWDSSRSLFFFSSKNKVLRINDSVYKNPQNFVNHDLFHYYQSKTYHFGLSQVKTPLSAQKTPQEVYM